MDLRAIGMGLLFALIWSSAFTSARIIVADAPPFAISAIRFTIAGVIGVAIARALGQTWHLTRDQWRATLIFGLCKNALYLGLNFLAMTTVEAGLASIVASTMPLIVANLIAGALLAFSFSMLEVSDSLMLAQRTEFYPITKTIYELFQLLGTGKYLASALGVWAMVFLAVTIIGASLLLGKKMGALFRV